MDNGGGSISLPDSSSSNELQKLSQSGNTISLSNGGGSVSITDNDKQSLSLKSGSLSISNGNSVTLPDSDNTNEIQELGISGGRITLDNGGGVVNLPDSSSTNELQTLTKNGTKIVLSNDGGEVTDLDSQRISIDTGHISITSGNTVALPDASDENEIQTLSYDNDTLKISQGNFVVLKGSANSGDTSITYFTNASSKKSIEERADKFAAVSIGLPSGNGVVTETKEIIFDTITNLKKNSRLRLKFSINFSGGYSSQNNSKKLTITILDSAKNAITFFDHNQLSFFSSRTFRSTHGVSATWDCDFDLEVHETVVYLKAVTEISTVRYTTAPKIDIGKVIVWKESESTTTSSVSSILAPHPKDVEHGMAEFKSTTNWIVPKNTYWIKVTMIGAGGGGASNTGSSGCQWGGGGGGAGGYVYAYTPVTGGDTLVLSVGERGSPGYYGYNSGAAGTDTKITTGSGVDLVIAEGGKGGSGKTGGAGGRGIINEGSGFTRSGGSGSTGRYKEYGPGGVVDSQASSEANGYGNGGGGSSCPGGNGSIGQNGYIFLEW